MNFLLFFFLSSLYGLPWATRMKKKKSVIIRHITGRGGIRRKHGETRFYLFIFSFIIVYRATAILYYYKEELIQSSIPWPKCVRGPTASTCVCGGFSLVPGPAQSARPPWCTVCFATKPRRPWLWSWSRIWTIWSVRSPGRLLARSATAQCLDRLRWTRTPARHTDGNNIKH